MPKVLFCILVPTCFSRIKLNLIFWKTHKISF